MINFKYVEITPEMARHWLQNNNEGNRGIKTGVVKKYAVDLVNSKWKLTHQCVAFDASGNLVDGQHRLSAVVLANKPMAAYVATYETNEQAMKLPIDMQAKRAVFEVLQVGRRDQETVSAALRLIRGSILPSMSDIEIAIANAREELDIVNSCIVSTVKHRSAAPARAAIMLLLRAYPDHQGEIASSYKRFVSMEVADLPTSVQALLKHLDGCSARKSGGADQRDLLLRTYYSFNPNNFHVKIIRILDPDSLIRSIRAAGSWLLGFG